MKNTKTQNWNRRRAVLIGILLIPAVFFVFCSGVKDNHSFRFVFMTDIHVQPELRGVEGYKAAIARVNQLKPDFVITGGDLVMDALGQSFQRADSLYRIFEETSREFTMPVYHCIGNHEHFGVYTRSGIQPDHPEYGKKMFANRLGDGKTYRSFDFGEWHFILMDAVSITPEREYTGLIDDQQLAWLKEDLQNIGPDQSVVLALHIPLYSVRNQFTDGPLAANTAGLVVSNSDAVWKIIQDYKVQIVLQGHLHVVEEIVWKGTHFITGGAVCGRWWKGPFEGFPEGFVVVDVEGDYFTWWYETFEWNAGE
jgi:Icc protein